MRSTDVECLAVSGLTGADAADGVVRIPTHIRRSNEPMIFRHLLAAFCCLGLHGQEFRREELIVLRFRLQHAHVDEGLL